MQWEMNYLLSFFFLKLTVDARLYWTIFIIYVVLQIAQCTGYSFICGMRIFHLEINRNKNLMKIHSFAGIVCIADVH